MEGDNWAFILGKAEVETAGAASLCRTDDKIKHALESKIAKNY